MLIYLFAIISIPIYNIIFPNKKLFVSIVTLQLFLILALRDVTMGVDLGIYADYYHNIQSLSWDMVRSSLHLFSRASYPVGIESGYGMLNWLSAQAALSYHGFLVVCAAVSIFPVGLFVYRYSNKPYLSFMLYVGLSCYFQTFGILRQSVALGILLLSIPYMLKHQWLKVSLFIFVAWLFHRVAILWIVLCGLYSQPVTRSRCLAIILGCLCVVPFVETLSNTVLYPLLDMLNKGEYTSVYDVQYNNLFMLMWLVIAFITFFVNMNVFKDSRTKLSFWGLSLALIIEIFALYNTTMARAAQLFYIFIIILVPNVLSTYVLPAERGLKSPYRSFLLRCGGGY